MTPPSGTGQTVGQVGRTDGQTPLDRRTDEHVTPTQFAQSVGRTARSITRYIQEGRIRATQTNMGWRIPRSEVDRFLSDPSFKIMRSNWAGQTDRQTDEPRRTDSQSVGQTDEETDRQTYGQTSEQPTELVPISAFHRVFDRLEEAEAELRRSEQQRLAMAMTLQQHQRVLAEHAESIVEREARARQAEAVAEAARAAAQVVEEEARLREEELAASNAARLEQAAAVEVAEWRARELETALATERQQRAEAEARAEALARRPLWKRLFG